MAKPQTMRGTCPCCFREHDVDGVTKQNPGGRMHKHGWREVGGRQQGSYGFAWHTGECFGVGYPAFELSPEGTWDVLEKVVFPHALRLENELARLATLPKLRIAYQYNLGYDRRTGRYRYEGRDVTLAGPGATADIEVSEGGYTRTLRYDEEHTKQVEAARAEQRSVRGDGAKLCTAATDWVEQPLKAKAAKAVTQHFAPEPEGRWFRPVCGSRSHYVKVTSDWAAVTCSRCLKVHARDQADNAQRELQKADAARLTEYIANLKGSAQRRGVPAKSIKADLGWDTKRLNKALDGAAVQRTWDRPARYMSTAAYTAHVQEKYNDA